MFDADRVKLLYGPYEMPNLRVGDRAFCLLRDCDVIITSISDARIPWPRCRAVEGTHGGGSGLWLGGDLAIAVQCESSAAVMHWWRVSDNSVWHMRKALDVSRTNNEGTQRLIREASELGREVMKEREWSEADRQHRRELAMRLDLERHLGDGFHRAFGWTVGPLRLLGKLPDAEVAKRTGRTVEAVRVKRGKLGLANPESPASQEPVAKRGPRSTRRCGMDAAVWRGDARCRRCWRGTGEVSEGKSKGSSGERVDFSTCGVVQRPRDCGQRRGRCG
jgi:hypothetical protein